MPPSNDMPPVNDISPLTPETVPTQTPDTPTIPSASQVNQPKSGKGKFILLVIVGLLVLGGAMYGAYYMGTKKQKVTTQTMNASSATTIMVPKEATVTAECTDNRGKQYIVPKDIPDGPIYDVNNGKVVAVEYLVDTNAVIQTPDKFMNLTLNGGTFDHLTVMPMDAHAGVNEKHVHVIAYTISADEAAKITCSSSNSDMNMTTTHSH